MLFRKAIEFSIIIALSAILSVTFSTNNKVEAWDDLWWNVEVTTDCFEVTDTYTCWCGDSVSYGWTGGTSTAHANLSSSQHPEYHSVSYQGWQYWTNSTNVSDCDDCP